MQHCDSTCHWCAAEFWRWYRRYVKQRRGRPEDGVSDYGAAAATSVRP